jgi:hypothetical protein
MPDPCVYEIFRIPPSSYRLPGEDGPKWNVAESLDSMDDEALNRTYRSVLEHRAKQCRA